MVTETIGVRTCEDYKVLSALVEKERLDYSVHFDDELNWYEVVVINGQRGHILRVLKALDVMGIFYDTTAPLPTVGDY